MIATILRAALPTLLLLLASHAEALDLRRWDADVRLVRDQVLNAIGNRAREPGDPVGPDRYFDWLLDGLKEVRNDLDADAYLIMREAVLTLAEEMGTVRDTLCLEDLPTCQQRIDWPMLRDNFSLKLDFVRNVMAIMD
jgi:hypothetical protein